MKFTVRRLSPLPAKRSRFRSLSAISSPQLHAARGLHATAPERAGRRIGARRSPASPPPPLPTPPRAPPPPRAARPPASVALTARGRAASSALRGRTGRGGASALSLARARRRPALIGVCAPPSRSHWSQRAGSGVGGRLSLQFALRSRPPRPAPGEAALGPGSGQGGRRG